MNTVLLCRFIASGASPRDLVACFLIASDCHLDDIGWKVDGGADQEAEMLMTPGGFRS